MWNNLLWKDARQMLPSVLICVGFVLLGQFLAIGGWFDRAELHIDIALVLAVVGPIIVGLACAGMSIGNERQSKTMHWSSTLPIPWYRALLSQILITLACIGTTVVITSWIAGHSHFVPRDPYDESILNRLNVLANARVAVEVLVFAIMFLLVIDEPLYALAAAGFTTILVNAGLHQIWKEKLGVAFFQANAAVFESILRVLFLVLAGLSVYVAVSTYRWRWTTGQQTTWSHMTGSFGRRRWFFKTAQETRLCSQSRLSLRERLVNTELSRSESRQLNGLETETSTSNVRAVEWNSPTSSAPNRPFRTLLYQSLRQAPYFRLAVLLAPWILAFAFTFEFTADRRFDQLAVAGFSPLSVMLLGLSCFVTDHARQRYRFLAERGVPAWKFYWARMLPTLGLCLVVIAIAVAVVAMDIRESGSSNFWEQISFFCFACCGYYFLCQLGSLCFRNVLFGFCAANAVAFGAMTVFLFFFAPGNHGLEIWQQYHRFISWVATIVIGVWSVFLIAWSAWWIVPGWLRWEQHKLRLAIQFLLSGIVIPLAMVVIAAIGAYWSIPEPTWPSDKLTAADLQESHVRPFLDLSISGPENDTFISGGLRGGSFVIGTVHGWRPTFSWQRDHGFLRAFARELRKDFNLKAVFDWLDELKTGLAEGAENLQKVRDRSSMMQWEVVRKLEFWSRNCDGLIYAAALNENRELLKHAVGVSLMFRQFDDVVDPILRMKRHQSTLDMLSLLSNDKLRWIAESHSLKPLLTEAISLAEYRRWAIERAIAFEDITRSIDKASEKGWTEHFRLQSFHMEPFRPFGVVEPQWFTSLLGFTTALANRYGVSTMSREMMAEIETLDQLIGRDDKQFSYIDGLHTYLKMRWKMGLNSSSPPGLRVHLSTVLESRYVHQKLANRVAAIEVSQATSPSR